MKSYNLDVCRVVEALKEQEPDWHFHLSEDSLWECIEGASSIQEAVDMVRREIGHSLAFEDKIAEDEFDAYCGIGIYEDYERDAAAFADLQRLESRNRIAAQRQLLHKSEARRKGRRP